MKGSQQDEKNQIINKSISHIMLHDITEWMSGKSGRLPLSNIDQTSEREDGMVRRNTLQHYNVMDGSRMALLYKFSPDDEPAEDEDPYGKIDCKGEKNVFPGLGTNFDDLSYQNSN
jgi:hypothetical protein